MPHKEIRFKEAVDYVKKTFFPQWDRSQAWAIKYSPDHPEVEFCQGKCCPEIKTIYLGMMPDDDTELHALLIHEICHALSDGHGKTWQQRFLKAANQADRIGNNKLSQMINREVESYRNTTKIMADTVYGRVTDVVLDTYGEISFERIRHMVAHYVGGYDSANRYKRLRKVYEKAVKDNKKMIRMMEKRGIIRIKEKGIIFNK